MEWYKETVPIPNTIVVKTVPTSEALNWRITSALSALLVLLWNRP